MPLAYPGLFWRRYINSGPSRLSFHSRTSGNRASDAIQIIDDWLFTVDKRPAAVKFRLFESIKPLFLDSFFFFLFLLRYHFSILTGKVRASLRLTFSVNYVKLQDVMMLRGNGNLKKYLEILDIYKGHKKCWRNFIFQQSIFFFYLILCVSFS